MKKILFLLAFLSLNAFAVCSPYNNDPNFFQISLKPSQSIKWFIRQQDDHNTKTVLYCHFNPQTTRGDYLDVFVNFDNQFTGSGGDITADPHFPVTFRGSFLEPVKPSYSNVAGGYVNFTLQSYNEHPDYNLLITCCDPDYNRGK